MTELEKLKAAYYEARAERDAAYAALAHHGLALAAASDAYDAALAAQEKEQDA